MRGYRQRIPIKFKSASLPFAVPYPKRKVPETAVDFLHIHEMFDHQIYRRHSRCWFRILHVVRKRSVVEQTQLAIVKSITNMTKWSMVLREMNLSYSYVCINAPKNLSSLTIYIYIYIYIYLERDACQYNLRADTSQFREYLKNNVSSNDVRYCTTSHMLKLRHWYLCQFTLSFHALFRVAFHVITSWQNCLSIVMFKL